MRTGVTLSISQTDLDRLHALVKDRNAPQKHVWRAQIVLLSAGGLEGLLRDKMRPSRVPQLAPSVAERVVELTFAPPPGETIYWTSALMAKAVGVSVSSIQRIWRAHGLQPHRVRQFKLSNDPEFVAKLRDVVGLYVNPPAYAVVLSLDEKSQIQALDRSQPGLPIKKGRAGTMTHDYVRNGTTTLLAAMNVLDGTIIGQNMQRHRHQEISHPPILDDPEVFGEGIVLV